MFSSFRNAAAAVSILSAAGCAHSPIAASDPCVEGVVIHTRIGISISNQKHNMECALTGLSKTFAESDDKGLNGVSMRLAAEAHPEVKKALEEEIESHLLPADTVPHEVKLAADGTVYLIPVSPTPQGPNPDGP